MIRWSKKQGGSSLKKRFVCGALVVAVCCGLSAAQAQSTATVKAQSGKPMFAVTFIDTGEEDPEGANATYTLSAASKQAVTDGLAYWAELLGNGACNETPYQVFVSTDDAANANAVAYSFAGGAQVDALFTQQALQDGKPLAEVNLTMDELPSADTAFSSIHIGTYLGAASAGAQNGWYVGAATLLPENEAAADLTATMRHEIGHALGISHSVRGARDDVDGNRVYRFDETAAQANGWNSHLIDQNGNRARPGMEAVTSQEFARLQSERPDLQVSDYFIVDNLQDAAADANTPTAGKLYFVGTRLSEVLDGKTFDGVDGLPVTGWEAYANGRYAPDFSHLEIGGLMSHRLYRNYTSFIEAELAVLQDLGYDIDRGAYYGFSVYDDGRTLVNTRGYAARNATESGYLAGVYSQTALGVGLHLYGSQNTVTQAADILTAGAGAAGVRLDGADNTLVIAPETEVRADGYRGIGILAAYGGGHRIRQDGAVTADGAGGVGVRFDFGSNVLGGDEYRGSYIRYFRLVDSDGVITDSYSFGFDWDDVTNYQATPELDGPLVETYDLRGYLSGEQNAIYIGKNAFVRQINILDHAVVRGDITSDWKHFATAEGIYDAFPDTHREALEIQYNGGLYAYDSYIPELVTQLNFAADTRYDGNIHGADNIKLRVQSRRLLYTGAADIVSATVDAGAELLGGTYILYDMQDKLAPGFADETTGKLINHGVIGALTPTEQSTVMTIRGDLVSDGAIRFTAYRDLVGRVVVEGDVDIAGSRLVIDPAGVYTPGAVYDPSVQSEKRGAAADFASMDAYATGMLTACYDDGLLSFQREDHLTGKTAVQQAMQDVVDAILDRRGDLADDYAVLYNLDAARAKDALQSVYGGMQANLAALLKRDAFLPEAVYDRLAERPDEAGEIWASVQKGWNTLDGDAEDLGAVKDHVWHIAVGKDRRLDAHWVAGGTLVYGRHNASLGASSGTIGDYRAAFYGGFADGALSVDAYLSYGQQKHDATRRIVQLGASAHSNYSSDTFGAGMKARFDLQCEAAQPVWRLSPYASMDALWYRQRGYREVGAGVYDQIANPCSDRTVTAGLGIEAKRALGTSGAYGVWLGYKRMLEGEETALTSGFAVDPTQFFAVRATSMGRDRLIWGAKGDVELHEGFAVQGAIQQELGGGVRLLSASVRANWKF